jgi:hypothetical protein
MGAGRQAGRLAGRQEGGTARGREGGREKGTMLFSQTVADSSLSFSDVKGFNFNLANCLATRHATEFSTILLSTRRL